MSSDQANLTDSEVTAGVPARALTLAYGTLVYAIFFGTFCYLIGWVAALVATYIVAFYFMGELLLSKMKPWTGTMFFLGLPTAIGMLGYMPQPIQVAFGIYVEFSLILIFFMRYGGCEVVALPSLLMGKRYTMYCPYNAIDAVESGVTPDADNMLESYLALLSLAITLFVGSWFIFIERSRLLDRYGVDWHIDDRWAMLLLVPAAHVAWRGWHAWREAGRLNDARVIKYALGSLILALYVGVFLGLVPFGPLWMGAMGAGGLYVLFEVFQFATGRRKFGENVQSESG